ncbi:MAG: smalltalk protein [Prevotella sp.]|nr:smalltalk protein [Prevotella sp.]MBR3513332.1 smalltalk protein [Bacteroidaceae bacterium]
MDKETKKRIWSWAVQALIAALTALATALGITSCIGQ